MDSSKKWNYLFIVTTLHKSEVKTGTNLELVFHETLRFCLQGEQGCRNK